MPLNKLATVIAIGILTALLPRFVAAEVPKTTNTEVSLKDRLITGLRATRPEDIQYCERVANATRTGKLPPKIVDSTYFWATAKQTNYPLPAFAKALDLQCQKLGIRWQ
ncbi:MAG: hypothetical protein HN345_03230 [Planctomycetaceae bacterium]|nr:hypothetical protein [Planctomycetaceae bacterium]MBT6641930.1 hypothetical protein [Planctomycetaceae bacterium]